MLVLLTQLQVITYALIQTISSILGPWVVRRSTAVIPTGTIGPLLGPVAAAPTACTSTARTSTQARTTSASTTGGWSGASLAFSISFSFFNSPRNTSGTTATLLGVR